MNDIEFVENVPYRSPEGPLDNMIELFKDKVVMDLGCGGADLMLYIKYKLNCKDIFGIEQTDRCITNAFKYRLKIIKSNILSQNFEGMAETYYIWIETPEIEIEIIKRLLNHNKKCNIILSYNTKGSCKYDPSLPNNNNNYNLNCNMCGYLACIPEKLNIIKSFLESNNVTYETKIYNYNNGIGCRESGEFTYLVISID